MDSPQLVLEENEAEEVWAFKYYGDLYDPWCPESPAFISAELTRQVREQLRKKKAN